MARLHLLAAAAVIGCASAFTTPARSVALSRRTAPKAGPFDDPDAFVAPSPPPKGRLGSSVDQDGKSNIWAVEPKMAVDQDAGASGGGLIAIGAGAVLALGLIAGAFLFINVEQ
mmetsp:Transcript_13081/g.34730  ORF Transcript_13081/g.34730 Transcript_13081/m.34730 type:complete len:114 (+) Transcript_13081:75-416(+)